MDGPTAHVYVLASEWEDLKETVREARQFAQEARDSSLENQVVLKEAIKPALERGEAHLLKNDGRIADLEQARNKTEGALWAFGVIGALIALGLAALPFLLRGA